MKKIKDGELGEIYSQYYSAVFLYLLSLCKNRELAEDITQDTFFKAMLSLGEGHEVLPWLFTVAKNLFIDHCRKYKRYKKGDIKDLPGEYDVPEEVLSGEKNRRLYAEIQKLPHTEREAVTLYYFAGLSQLQISRQMGLSYTNLRTVLYRARRKLYTKLKEE